MTRRSALDFCLVAERIDDCHWSLDAFIECMWQYRPEHVADSCQHAAPPVITS